MKKVAYGIILSPKTFEQVVIINFLYNFLFSQIKKRLWMFYDINQQHLTQVVSTYIKWKILILDIQ